MSTTDVIESARREIGLAHNQLTPLLGVDREESARRLLRAYRAWRTQVLNQIGTRELPTSEAAYMLGLSMWHMLGLVRDGQVTPSRSTGRQHYFNQQSIAALFDLNKRFLEDPAKRRGPLAGAFLRHMTHRKAA